LKLLPLLLSFAFVGNALTATPQTPGEIEARIHKEGGRAVIKDLEANESAFEEILSHIDSGDGAWLKVALLLKPFSDAGTAEGLDYAVARALPNAPVRVLSLIGHGFDLDYVCTSPFNEPEPGVAESYERKTLGALASVREPHLKVLAAECAKRVKLPSPGPNYSLKRTAADGLR